MNIENEKNVEIKVVGIGKTGNSALDEIIKAVEADFVAVSEKQENLDLSEAGIKILVAEDFEKKIQKALENTDMLFILAETDEVENVKISTAVAKIAQSLDILTISIIAAPSEAEFAKTGKAELKQFADIVITVPTEKISEEINKIFIKRGKSNTISHLNSELIMNFFSKGSKPLVFYLFKISSVFLISFSLETT
mgnify:CR=1 FL=1